MLSDQPLPYLGKGCPYCRVNASYQEVTDYAAPAEDGSVLVEHYRCASCNRAYTLVFALSHYIDDAATTWPVSVNSYSDLPMARAVYPEVVNDLLDRVGTGFSKYGCVLSTHNGRSALQDVYEELLDALLYLKQRLMEDTDEQKRG